VRAQGRGGRIVGMGAWGVAVGHARRSVGEGGLPRGGSATAGGGGVEWPCRVGEREGEGVLPLGEEEGCCANGKSMK
jgi:hypothetical protein